MLAGVLAPPLVLHVLHSHPCCCCRSQHLSHFTLQDWNSLTGLDNYPERFLASLIATLSHIAIVYHRSEHWFASSLLLLLAISKNDQQVENQG